MEGCSLNIKSLGKIDHFVLIGLILMLSSGTFAAEWRLDLERGGIKVYTAKADGSQKMKFRGETTYKSNIEHLESAFHSIEDIGRWQYPSYDLRIIEETEHSKLVYMKQRAPNWAFLVKDRDVVLRYLIEKKVDSIRVVLQSVEDKVEKQKGLVRLTRFEGEWDIQQVKPDSVKVTYEAFVDPGGALPSKVTNVLVTDTPFKTLTLLRQYLQEQANNSDS